MLARWSLNNSINRTEVTINYFAIAEDVLNAIKNDNGTLHIKLNDELMDLANIRSQSNLFIENDIIRFTDGVIYDRIFRIPDYNPKENFDIATLGSYITSGNDRFFINYANQKHSELKIELTQDLFFVVSELSQP